MRAAACAALALAALLVAPRARPAVDEAVPLEIEYGGCRDVVHGACVVDAASELRLWVRTAVDGRVEIERDGARTQPSSADAVQGGTRYAIAIEPGDERVVVRTTRADAARTWSLRLAPDTRSDGVKRAAAALASGDVEQARALVATLDATDSDALGLLGRIQNLAGETEAARATLRDARARHADEGRALAAVKDATVVAYSLMLKGRRFAEARALLDRFADTPDASAEERYYLAYYRGLLAYNSGDDRGTLRQLGAAADQAARMGWARLQLTAEQTLAVQLQVLGRRAEATALLATWAERLDVLPNDCERAMFLNNVGWTRLLALEAGESAADPLPVLERAYATFASPAAGGLCNADEQVNGLLNLALAHLHAGDADRAAQYLERAHGATQTPELRMVLWSLDIEARVALERGDAQGALAFAEQLRELGAATVSPEAVWRGVVREALAYERLERRADALAAFAEAERLLDGQLFRVPVNEGRETLLAAHAWASRRYVALLLAAGRSDEAFAIARRAGARALRSLRPAELIGSLDGAARARWDASMARYLALREELTGLAQLGWVLPRDELERIMALHARRERELDALLDDALAELGPQAADPAPAPRTAGTLEVAFHPLPDGWVTFAADAQGVRAHVTCAHERGVPSHAACLLAPLAAAVAQAQRVRLLVPDELRHVDFHALALEGDVLLARAPVAYGLDLPAIAGVARPGRALVVGDAQGNLSAAQEEIRSVRDALEASGAASSVKVLRGDDAELERVRGALAAADLFHYAGHARALGARGWDSELELGRRTALDVSDILALEHVPGFVVLSGCETAATDAATEAGGIGLAQAFVASGAHTVLATSRPVRDATALAVVRSFYDAWLGGAAPDVALQRAQLELRRDTADADWSAFRLIER